MKWPAAGAWSACLGDEKWGRERWGGEGWGGERWGGERPSAGGKQPEAGERCRIHGRRASGTGHWAWGVEGRSQLARTESAS